MTSQYTPLKDITDWTRNLITRLRGLEKYHPEVSSRNNISYQRLLFTDEQINTKANSKFNSLPNTIKALQIHLFYFYIIQILGNTFL